MARVSYSSKKNKFVLLGLIVCLICLLFFSTTFALLAFQESFSVDITLGFISLNDIGQASLDVSNHDVGDLVCSNGISFVKDPMSRNLYARVKIYYYSTDDLTTSNKRYIALLNGMIQPASYDDYTWTDREIDSYYLTTTYGAPYKIDEFTGDTRFYFLDSLTLGQGVEKYLEKYDRPEHLFLNVEIQAVQSEYFNAIAPGVSADNPSLQQVKKVFADYFGDVNRLDYQLVLYHDIYNELFDIGFVEYGRKLFEPTRPQFIVGNFKHWCTTSDACEYKCTAGSCSCGDASCKCKDGGCPGGECTCSSCVCSHAYDFDSIVTKKLYLYSRYDVEMGDINELFLFKLNTDGTYKISQNFKKDANGNYIISGGKVTSAISGGVVIPKYYNFGEVTSIEFLYPENADSTLKTAINNSGFQNKAFGNNPNMTGIVISETVKNIQSNAFYGDYNLVNLGIFEGVQTIGERAFYGCTSLVTVDVPDSVTSLGMGTFENCKSIENIELPFVGTAPRGATGDNRFFGSIFNTYYSADGMVLLYCFNQPADAEVIDVVKHVSPSEFAAGEDDTYYSDENYIKVDGRDIYYNGTTTRLYQLRGVSFYTNYFYVPKNLTRITINGGVVYQCSLSYISSLSEGFKNVKEITFGNNVEKIESYACCGTVIETLNISNCSLLTEIGDFAFFGCQNLTTVKIENNEKLYRIGKGAFAWGALYSISFEGSNSLSIVAKDAFALCSDLRMVEFPESVTEIGDYAFFNCANLELPEFSLHLIHIGDFAFYNCKNIYEIDFSHTNLAHVGHYAFDVCTNVETIRFPETLAYVGDYSFSKCSKIRDFNVPKSVTYMGTGCIAGCYNLSQLTIPFVGRQKAARPTSDEKDERANIQSSSKRENLFSNLFSVYIPSNLNEKNHDVRTTIYEVTDYKSEYYAEKPSEYSIALQSYYQIDPVNYKGVNYYGVHTYIFAFIPKSITKVTVQAGHVRVGAFSGLSSVTEFVLEKGVTGIDQQAFINTVNVTNISLPFVGVDSFDGTTLGDDGKPQYTKSTVESLFGIIFDSYDEYMDYNTGNKYIIEDKASGAEDEARELIKITQHYGDSDTQTKDYIIPFDLSSIVIYGGKLQYGCLSGMRGLRSATVEEGCLGLGQNMFFDCVNLTSLTLGLITDDVTYNAPANSTLLGYYFGCTDNAYNKMFYTLVGQRYKNGDDSTFDLTSYVPKGLTNITINGGHIQYGAVMNFSMIKSVLVTGNARSIGDYAFYNTGMTSLVVQNLRALTSFGKYAFANNIYLPSAIFANNQLLVTLSDHLFDGCRVLTKIDYTGSPKLSSAQVSTFARCISINSIKDVLPSTVISIGDYCFEECKGLDEIEIYPTLVSVGRYAFLNCNGAQEIIYGNPNFLEIPEGVFRGCSGLRKLTIGESIITIGAYAFSNCKGADEIIYNDYVTEIPYRCFEYCTGLGAIVIGPMISKIGEGAFSHCENAEYIQYNDRVTKIEAQTFEHCYKLKISFGTKVTHFGDYAFAFSSRVGSDRVLDFTGSVVASNGFGKACFAFCGLEKIDLSAKTGITWPEYCFYENRSNKQIVFPTNGTLTSLPAYCFANNTSLESLTIPTGMTTIGRSCFEYCVSLKTITIPTQMTILKNRIFRATTGLTNLVVPRHITEITDYNFAGFDNFNKMFYDDTDPLTPYKALETYMHYNVYPDYTEKYIREDSYDSEHDEYEPHPNMKPLKYWLDCYLEEDGLKPENVGPISVDAGLFSERAITDEILGTVDKLPLVMNITGIDFETWNEYEAPADTASLNTIGDHAFYLNTKLKNLHMPKSIRTIKDYAFASVNLGDVTFKEDDTRDRNQYRMRLEYVVFPNGSALTTLGKHAFSQNVVEQMFFVSQTTSPTIDSTAFTYNNVEGTSANAIYVPNASAQNSFKAAASSNLDSRIYRAWNGSFTYSGALTPELYGKGTESVPFDIFHANQLAYMSDYVNGGKSNYSGKYFKLRSNISFPTSNTGYYVTTLTAVTSGNKYSNMTSDSNINWRPIGAANSFMGHLDGNNKAIVDLQLQAAVTKAGMFYSGASYEVQGLFGHIHAGSVKNLSFNNVRVNTSQKYTGVLAACAACTIDKIVVNDNASYNIISSGSWLGGIISGQVCSGLSTALTITNCDLKESIASSTLYAGGIVGVIPSSSTTTTIKTCTTADNYNINSGKSSNPSYVGGIIGSTSNKVTVNDVTNNSNVRAERGSNPGAGGIVGYYDGGTITSTINHGDIRTTSGYTGGYIGYANSSFNGSGGLIKTGVTYTEFTLTNNSNAYYIGGVIGGCTDSISINNVTMRGKFKASGGEYVGGIVSFKSSTFSLKGNVNEATITATNSKYVGGIIGCLLTGGVVSTYTNVNKGNVTATGAEATGGIMGFLGSGYEFHSSSGGTTNSGKIVGKNNVGGICGKTGPYNGSYGLQDASYLTNNGEVVGEQNVGGIFGYCDYGKRLNVLQNSGKITGTEDVGGCIGQLDTSWDVNITNCSNSGAITTSYNAGSYVGGIIGWKRNTNGANHCYIQNSTNSGRIEGRVAGGLMGCFVNAYHQNVWNNQSSYIDLGSEFCHVVSCRNTGTVVGSYPGGMIGNGTITFEGSCSNNQTYWVGFSYRYESYYYVWFGGSFPWVHDNTIYETWVRPEYSTYYIHSSNPYISP